MTKISRWIYDHPWRTALYAFLIDLCVLYFLSTICGCAPRPPAKFDNGDRTVWGPKSWGEVTDDPGMAPPEVEK